MDKIFLPKRLDAELQNHSKSLVYCDYVAESEIVIVRTMKKQS